MKRTLINTGLVFLMIAAGACAGRKSVTKNDARKGERTGHHAHEKKESARRSYERAKESMLLEESVNSDVLWGLMQLNKKGSALDAFIEKSKSTVYHRFYIPCVFPELPRIELSEDLGRGIKRFFNNVKVPFGGPEKLAESQLRNFIDEECSGYIRTHQFLCLVWAEQGGLSVTEAMRGRRQQLLDNIYEEQCGVDKVDSVDLYMERVALILMYGPDDKVDSDIVDQWIDTIIDMQLADGSWPLSKTLIEYDGASTLLSSPRSHTTVLAMMALDSYIHTGK